MQLAAGLSTLFVNDLLKKMEQFELGAAIGTVNFPALAFADDIVPISDDPCKLQKLIKMFQKWSEINKRNSEPINAK